jgi:GTP-binding protein
MRVEFRTDENPYAGRRNELTPRQQRKRKRMVRSHRRGTGKR